MNELAHLKTNFHWNISTQASLDHGIWFSKNPAPAVSYPSDGNDSCSAIEDNSFWFRHRSNIIKNAIQKYFRGTSLWDIGAGNGIVADALSEIGIEVICVEPGQNGALRCAQKNHPTLCGRFEDFSVPDNSLQAVGCFDVLEHIEDTQSFLSTIYKALAPDGLLFLTVPAGKYLWSEVDIYAGHFRRYTLSTLKDELESVGFKRIASHCFMFWMVVPVILLRVLPELIKGKTNHKEVIKRAENHLSGYKSKTVSFFLKRLLASELFWLKYFSLPFGSSAIGIFQKM